MVLFPFKKRKDPKIDPLREGVKKEKIKQLANISLHGIIFVLNRNNWSQFDPM